MSIRAAQMVHYVGPAGPTTRLLRAQNAGISNLNIPSEKVSEVGRDETLETVYETPEMTWEVESYDMTTGFEEIVTRATGVVDGTEIDFRDAKPVDIASPWTLKRASRTVDGGYIAPYLDVERVSYRFSNTGASSQTFSLRGDGAFFVPNGTPRVEEYTKSGVGPYSFADTALKTVLYEVDIYAVCVTIHRVDGTWKRLVHTTDYTDTSAGFTLSADIDAELADGSTIVASYGADALDVIDDDADDPGGIVLVPSQVKGKHVDLYISDGAATPTMVRWGDVQTYEATWSVQFEEDRELGTSYAVARDYDTPESSGSIVIRPRDVDTMMQRYAQITGADTGDIINVESVRPLRMEARIRNPLDANEVLKTLVVEDARINIAAAQGRARQKTDLTLPWNSDSGVLTVVHGLPA